MAAPKNEFDLRKESKRRDEADSQVLQHTQQLHTALDTAISEVQHGSCTSEQIIVKLQGMLQGVQSFSSSLSTRLDAKHYNQMRTADSIIASQVFSIPELAENILICCDIFDLVAMDGVNKAMRDIIDKSTVLQTKLNPQATDYKPYRSPFDGEYGSSNTHIGLSVTIKNLGREVEVIISRVGGKAGHMPRVGDRWLKMQVCQPPVTRLHIHRGCTMCAKVIQPYPGDSTRINCDSGFTIGDLWKRAQDSFRDKATCDRCVTRRIQSHDPIDREKWDARKATTKVVFQTFWDYDLDRLD